VLGDLLRLPGLNVVDTRSIVTTTRNNLVPFLWSVVWKELNAMFSECAYFIPTDRQNRRLVPIHRLSLRLTILPYLVYSHLWEPSESKWGNKVGQLTLLSQLPTARKSATGQKEREEMESGGGSATSISFSGDEETFAVVEFAPKKAMVQ
jgi:hypothetical protein